MARMKFQFLTHQQTPCHQLLCQIPLAQLVFHVSLMHLKHTHTLNPLSFASTCLSGAVSSHRAKVLCSG